MQFGSKRQSEAVPYARLVPSLPDDAGPLQLVAHDVHYARDGQQCLAALLVADVKRRIYPIVINLTVESTRRVPLSLNGLVKLLTPDLTPIGQSAFFAQADLDAFCISILPSALSVKGGSGQDQAVLVVTNRRTQKSAWFYRLQRPVNRAELSKFLDPLVVDQPQGMAFLGDQTETTVYDQYLHTMVPLLHRQGFNPRQNEPVKAVAGLSTSFGCWTSASVEATRVHLDLGAHQAVQTIDLDVKKGQQIEHLSCFRDMIGVTHVEKETQSSVDRLYRNHGTPIDLNTSKADNPTRTYGWVIRPSEVLILRQGHIDLFSCAPVQQTPSHLAWSRASPSRSFLWSLDKTTVTLQVDVKLVVDEKKPQASSIQIVKLTTKGIADDEEFLLLLSHWLRIQVYLDQPQGQTVRAEKILGSDGRVLLDATSESQQLELADCTAPLQALDANTDPQLTLARLAFWRALILPNLAETFQTPGAMQGAFRPIWYRLVQALVHHRGWIDKDRRRFAPWACIPKADVLLPPETKSVRMWVEQVVGIPGSHATLARRVNWMYHTSPYQAEPVALAFPPSLPTHLVLVRPASVDLPNLWFAGQLGLVFDQPREASYWHSHVSGSALPFAALAADEVLIGIAVLLVILSDGRLTPSTMVDWTRHFVRGLQLALAKNPVVLIRRQSKEIDPVIVETIDSRIRDPARQGVALGFDPTVVIREQFLGTRLKASWLSTTSAALFQQFSNLALFENRAKIYARMQNELQLGDRSELDVMTSILTPFLERPSQLRQLVAAYVTAADSKTAIHPAIVPDAKAEYMQLWVGCSPHDTKEAKGMDAPGLDLMEPLEGIDVVEPMPMLERLASAFSLPQLANQQAPFQGLEHAMQDDAVAMETGEKKEKKQGRQEAKERESQARGEQKRGSKRQREPEEKEASRGGLGLESGIQEQPQAKRAKTETKKKKKREPWYFPRLDWGMTGQAGDIVEPAFRCFVPAAHPDDQPDAIPYSLDSVLLLALETLVSRYFVYIFRRFPKTAPWSDDLFDAALISSAAAQMQYNVVRIPADISKLQAEMATARKKFDKDVASLGKRLDVERKRVPESNQEKRIVAKSIKELETKIEKRKAEFDEAMKKKEDGIADLRADLEHLTHSPKVQRKQSTKKQPVAAKSWTQKEFIRARDNYKKFVQSLVNLDNDPRRRLPPQRPMTEAEVRQRNNALKMVGGRSFGGVPMIQPEGPLRPVDWNNVASPTEDEQQLLDIFEAGFSIQLAEEEPAPASETKDKPKTGREKKQGEAEAEWKAPPGLERQAREAGEKKMMTRQERKYLDRFSMVMEAALAEANDDDGEDEVVGVKAEPEEEEEEEGEGKQDNSALGVLRKMANQPGRKSWLRLVTSLVIPEANKPGTRLRLDKFNNVLKHISVLVQMYFQWMFLGQAADPERKAEMTQAREHAKVRIDPYRLVIRFAVTKMLYQVYRATYPFKSFQLVGIGGPRQFRRSVAAYWVWYRFTSHEQGPILLQRLVEPMSTFLRMIGKETHYAPPTMKVFPEGMGWFSIGDILRSPRIALGLCTIYSPGVRSMLASYGRKKVESLRKTALLPACSGMPAQLDAEHSAIFRRLFGVYWITLLVEGQINPIPLSDLLIYADTLVRHMRFGLVATRNPRLETKMRAVAEGKKIPKPGGRRGNKQETQLHPETIAMMAHIRCLQAYSAVSLGTFLGGIFDEKVLPDVLGLGMTKEQLAVLDAEVEDIVDSSPLGFVESRVDVDRRIDQFIERASIDKSTIAARIESYIDGKVRARAYRSVTRVVVTKTGQETNVVLRLLENPAARHELARRFLIRRLHQEFVGSLTAAKKASDMDFQLLADSNADYDLLPHPDLLSSKTHKKAVKKAAKKAAKKKPKKGEGKEEKGVQKPAKGEGKEEKGAVPGQEAQPMEMVAAAATYKWDTRFFENYEDPKLVKSLLDQGRLQNMTTRPAPSKMNQRAWFQVLAWYGRAYALFNSNAYVAHAPQGELNRMYEEFVKWDLPRGLEEIEAEEIAPGYRCDGTLQRERIQNVPGLRLVETKQMDMLLIAPPAPPLKDEELYDAVMSGEQLYSSSERPIPPVAANGQLQPPPAHLPRVKTEPFFAEEHPNIIPDTGLPAGLPLMVPGHPWVDPLSDILPQVLGESKRRTTPLVESVPLLGRVAPEMHPEQPVPDDYAAAQAMQLDNSELALSDLALGHGIITPAQHQAAQNMQQQSSSSHNGIAQFPQPASMTNLPNWDDLADDLEQAGVIEMVTESGLQAMEDWQDLSVPSMNMLITPRKPPGPKS